MQECYCFPFFNRKMSYLNISLSSCFKENISLCIIIGFSNIHKSLGNHTVWIPIKKMWKNKWPKSKNIFFHHVVYFSVLAPHVTEYKFKSVCVSCEFFTAGPAGCPGRRSLGPPAGFWPAEPASVWWWCHPSAPGRRCCPSAGRVDTDGVPLWLWGRNNTKPPFNITSNEIELQTWWKHSMKVQIYFSK